jgi:hypothetical protein
LATPPEARAGRATAGCSLWCGFHEHDHSAGLRGDVRDGRRFISSREAPTFRC